MDLTPVNRLAHHSRTDTVQGSDLFDRKEAFVAHTRK